MRKWWAIAVLAALSLSACAPTIETGPGVVSTSLCGDGYLLASGAEIAALSWQSGGPLSTVEGNYARANADAEELVAMAPSVLLLGPGETVRKGLLPETKIIQLEWVEDMEGVERNSSLLQPLIPTKVGIHGKRMDPDFRRGERGRGQQGKTALYLSRAGGTAGPGTYVDEAMQLAGVSNIVTRPGWFTPDPEWIVAQDADVVITSFTDSYESVNAALVRNRAVREWVADRPVIDVPGKLWPCAGPGLEQAVELIAAGVEG